MEGCWLSEQDRRDIQARGMVEAEVVRQWAFFLNPPRPIRLRRACRVGDGILRVDPKEVPELLRIHEQAAQEGRLMKFVPASGSASRMFNALIAYARREPGEPTDGISGELPWEVAEFLENLERFPFYPELRESMLGLGEDPLELRARGRISRILDRLLTDRGLGYKDLPKGLILFHRYGQTVRTAIEEHLLEAARYVTDARGVCRVHLTVSPGHRDRFMKEIERIRRLHEPKLGIQFRVGISVQDPSTDTIAVDMENRLFRGVDGRLLFRPGGHGALLQNLQGLHADVVFIKNVDNVAHQRLLDEIVFWKRILAGYLLRLQAQIRQLLARLGGVHCEESALGEALELVTSKLSIAMPSERELGSRRQLRQMLCDLLDRPLRVCAMVHNRGEPGGGPFWTHVPLGQCQLQIVESVQVDLADHEQREIWESSTHFNPVDMVCGLRDARGDVYDLERFADKSAVMITRKWSEGRKLKALELPGLWNGGMAGWNTVFIEVPEVTFQPVKTVNDLLRPGHQPDG